MIGLHVAQLFKRSAAGTLERVLWIDDLGRGLYAIDVESSSALPVFHRANVILDGLGDGTVEVVMEDPWLQPISEEAIPPIQRARRDQAWALIKPLVMDQPAIFQENTRGKAVQRVIAECDATKPRLYRLLRRYWQRGCCPNALLPDFHRCGGRGKVKAAGQAKRGRAASIGEPGVNVTPEMRALIREWATKSFARNRKMDFAASYHEFVSAHFSDRVIDEGTGRQIRVTRDNEVLSLRQFSGRFRGMRGGEAHAVLFPPDLPGRTALQRPGALSPAHLFQQPQAGAGRSVRVEECARVDRPSRKHRFAM